MNESTKSGTGGGESRPWNEETARLQRRTNELVRQRPLLALTMAVVGGYLAGRVFSRV